MKRIVLMILPVLICGIWFVSSCTKEDNAESALIIKTVVYLPTPGSYLAEENGKIDTLFKGNRIEWYNATTREIKFKTLDVESVPFGISGNLVKLIVCLDEEELFTLGAIAGISSISYDHPVLIHGGVIGYHPNTKVIEYQIGRGYPDWEYWTETFWKETGWDKTADWVKEREKNWKAIEQGWNKFIAQLKKEGKYRK